MNANDAPSAIPSLHPEPGQYLYDAFNDALDEGQSLKPWPDLTDPQRQTIVRHVRDMSLWRAEGKCDPGDVAERLEQYQELRDLLV